MAWEGVSEFAVKNRYGGDSGSGVSRGYRGARAQLRGILGIADQQKKRKKRLDTEGFIKERRRQMLTKGAYAGRPFGDD
jgi:hypothetical protein